MPPIFSIARNAFLEAIRQPIFIVLVLVGLLAMVCNVNLAAFTMGEDEKLLVDLGLSTLLIWWGCCWPPSRRRVCSRRRSKTRRCSRW
jgi:hypothetical protein